MVHQSPVFLAIRDLLQVLTLVGELATPILYMLRMGLAELSGELAERFLLLRQLTLPNNRLLPFKRRKLLRK
ncbi:hypothetical protein D3C85_859900 [compost metagenome]